MAVFTPPDYRELYEQQKKETESWRNAAELFRETLRDQFAMSSLAFIGAAYPEKQGGYHKSVARLAYDLADEMMEARKVP